MKEQASDAKGGLAETEGEKKNRVKGKSKTDYTARDAGSCSGQKRERSKVNGKKLPPRPG